MQMLTLTARPTSPHTHWRWPSALLLALVLALVLPALHVDPWQPSLSAPAGAQGQPVAPGETPAGLSGAEWESIQAQIAAGPYRAYPQPDGGFASANPAHGWQIAYGTDGRTTLTPREAGAPRWQWGLTLSSYGYAQRTPVSRPVALSPGAERFSYQWDANLSEWWVNTPGGLQQGFTIQERPAGAAAGQPLRLDLAIAGGLRPALGDDVITFRDSAGAAAFTYATLRAWDATGRALPAVMGLAGGRITLSVDDAGAIYPLTIDPFVQQAYLKASNTGANDQFGRVLAIDGDTLVVGATFESSNATGVNGNQSDNSAFAAGAAYVFVRSGAIWTQQAYLKASNTAQDDQFGTAVAIAGDTIVVGSRLEDSNATGVNGNQSNNGASESGAAYIFVRDSGGTWSQQAYLKASNPGVGDNFGQSVAIASDTVVVGANLEASNATGVNGNQSDNSANLAGAAYVFTRSGSTWSQQAYLKASNTEASDQFGQAVAIAGDTIVVGAPGEDSNATGVNGNQSNNGASTSGAAYVFTRSGSTWSQQAYLKASNSGAGDNFGQTLAIDGDTIVVGAVGEASNATGVNGDQSDNSANLAGAAYVFVRDSGSAWSQQAYLKASNTGTSDFFGQFVAISGDTIVVGASGEGSNATGVDGNQSNNSAPFSGAAYTFTRSGTTWSQQAYLKASNTGLSDSFGFSVAIDGDTIVVGAYGEDSNTVGVNGNQSDNSASTSGAAYIFTPPPPPDPIAPTVTVEQAAGQADPASTSPVQFTVTFSEAVTGFTGADVTLGGTAGATTAVVTGGPVVYSVAVSGMTGDGTVVAAIPAGAAQDAASNPSAASTSADNEVTYDATAPFVVAIARTSASPTSAASVSWLITFSEAVGGVDAGDFSLAPSGVSGASITSVTGSGLARTVTANTGTGDGTLGLDLASAASITDSAGNALAGAPFAGQIYTIDTSAPFVASVVRAGASPTGAASVSFTLIFSEAVSGVDAGDFTLMASGISGASVTGITGSGLARTVTVATGAGSGTLRLNLADDDSITDGAGTPLGGPGAGNGGFTVGETYTIDRAAPTASLTVSAITSAGGTSHSFTVRFTDPSGVDVSSLDGSDIRVTGPNGFSQLATFISVDVSGNGTPRTATYRISAPGGAWDAADNGAYTIALLAGQVRDTLGNNSAAAGLGSFSATLSPSAPRTRIYLPLLAQPG